MGSDNETPRIFLGLTEIASYYANLVTGMRAEGVEATFVDLSGNPYSYGGVVGKPAWVLGIERFLVLIRGGKGIGVTPRKVLWAAVRMLLKVPVMVWALFRFDVFVFGAGTHFAGYYELALIKLLGKRSVVISHGTDTRPPYLSGRFVPAAGPIPAASLVRRTKRMKTKLKRVERWATFIVNHPPTAQLANRPFLEWLWLGLPMEVPADSSPDNDDVTMRVVHAPTSPVEKGTYEIREAIVALKGEGIDIEYVELIGRPNSEVLKEISRCHFVVDEIFSDTLLAGLGTEAAALGKAALVGGYELEQLKRSLKWPIPPSIVCSPDSLKESIAEMVSKPERTQALGTDARHFVTDNWSPRKVARRLLSVLSDGAPEAAFFHPDKNSYSAGWGLRRERAAEAIRGVVEQAGVEALRISSETTLRAVLTTADLGMP